MDHPKPKPPTRPDSPFELSDALWPFAGLLGMLVTASLTMTDRFSQRGTAVELFLVVLLGALTMIAFAPWKAILGGSRVRREVRHLTHQLRRAGHNEPLRGMLAGGDDDFGRLRRAIYNRLSEATAHRLEAGHLRRTMDDSIRRETGRATDRLQREVDTDVLTGVGNRRAMRKHLEGMLCEEAGQAGQPLVALVIDVDRFKPINDRLGHAVGDECLVFLGKILAGSLRGHDRAFRCGGDEFVILMSGANADIGIRLGQRICDLYRQMTWSHKAAVRPTLSMGIAVARPGQLKDPQDLIRRADEAMYESKREGRATITSYRDVRAA